MNPILPRKSIIISISGLELVRYVCLLVCTFCQLESRWMWATIPDQMYFYRSSMKGNFICAKLAGTLRRRERASERETERYSLCVCLSRQVVEERLRS